jgi:hypothetical protein
MDAANGNVSQSSVSLETTLPLEEWLNEGQINRLTALKRSCTDQPAPISSLPTHVLDDHTN